MTENAVTDHDDDYEASDGEIGCYDRGHSGWRHGCMDDMCRACTEPEDCPDGQPCRHCNPHGES